ncbi:hypothetical protein [Photorhabdus laumondii]|uniref:Lipoprotein n=1 Tax=Photorhabdus laumondii subsp. clarkei TaxID=2029685 RepID=A0A329VMT0_9GAMM|nr:hypothetical protein [Photorhabdus laumondii]RAW93104.1 hypothetical protein CKY01_03185 [Photorhabdus laumondii subsp. clarkei]
MNKFFIVLFSMFVITGCSSMPRLTDGYISTCGYFECNVKDIVSGSEVKVDNVPSIPDIYSDISSQDRQIIQSGGSPSFEDKSYRIRGTFKF